MKTLLGFALAALFLTLNGCTTAEKSFQSEGILDKVAYKFNCPKDQLKVDVLTRNEGLGCAGSEIGVSGCGHREIYVCNENQKWVVDPATPR